MKKIICSILTITMILAMITNSFVAAASYEFSESYENSVYYTNLKNVEITGNQRIDIVNIALSQYGYTEGNFNGDFGGASNGNQNYTEYQRMPGVTSGQGNADAGWCASFVSWCARQAGIPQSIIGNSTTSNINNFKLEKSSTAEIGSFAFIQFDKDVNIDHTALVYDVDDKYIYTIEGNRGDKVDKRKYNKSNGKQYNYSDVYIEFYGNPNYGISSHTCPEIGRNSEGEYGYETYKKGNATVYGACKECHKAYNWQATFKKTSTKTYEINKSNKNYVAKVRSMPYDGAPVLCDKVSKTFTVIGEVKNAYNNKWYAIDFQDDAKKMCYTAYVYGEQIEKYYTLSSTEVSAKQYTSANTITHKHDYSYANGKCYCGAVKEVKQEASTLKIDLTSYPTSIKQGSSFGLRGTISSNYNIKKVSGYIKQGETVIDSSEDTPNKKSLTVKTANLNEDLVFGKLSVGNYSLYVEAVDASGKIVRVTKNFSVYEETKRDESNLSINLERYPVSINVGSTFSVRGNITSNYSISKVKGYIYDASGNVIQSTTDTPNSKSMEIRPANLNQKLVFGKLATGNYTMKVEAVDVSGKVVTATKSFTVKGGNTPSGNTIKFDLETIPKGNLPYGKSFALKGRIRSDAPIVEAKSYMLDSNMNVIMESKAGKTTSNNYIIEGYALDTGMNFSKLNPGGYYLRYFARDADGDTGTWTSDMFYIVKDGNTSSGSSSSGQIISDGTYIIATKLDKNYVLDIDGAGTSDGDNLQLWERNDTPAQSFKVTHLGNGYYRIVNTNSGKALDAEWGGIDPGTNVWQYSINDTPAQIWKIVSAGNGSYYIINKESGLYLDVDNAWADSGTNVKLFDRNDAYDAQKWCFIKK